jgi:serine/threonine protein kinase
VSLLGSGGIGEVYRARDTKLDREVAIKVLPELFVADPERVARFQREARTLAALNHTSAASTALFEWRGHQPTEMRARTHSRRFEPFACLGPYTCWIDHH